MPFFVLVKMNTPIIGGDTVCLNGFYAEIKGIQDSESILNFNPSKMNNRDLGNLRRFIVQISVLPNKRKSLPSVNHGIRIRQLLRGKQDWEARLFCCC